MVVLQICQKPPFPPVDGGCIAMKQISETVLDLGHELIVLSMETYKHPYAEKNKLDQSIYYREFVHYKSIFVDIKGESNVSAFLNLFSKQVLQY